MKQFICCQNIRKKIIDRSEISMAILKGLDYFLGLIRSSIQSFLRSLWNLTQSKGFPHLFAIIIAKAIPIKGKKALIISFHVIYLPLIIR